MSPPPERNGRLKWRAICPVHSSPMPDSGVPNVGEPDCMSMLDRNEPKITGHPGRMSCARAMPDSASAICCTRAAGIVTGDIAPMRMNGVRTTGCAAAQYSNRASSMRSSQRRGELQLIRLMEAGRASIASRPPKRISDIAMTSRAFSPETTLPMNTLSVSVMSDSVMSRWRESRGASFGSQTTPPAESSTEKDWESFAKLR